MNFTVTFDVSSLNVGFPSIRNGAPFNSGTTGSAFIGFCGRFSVTTLGDLIVAIGDRNAMGGKVFVGTYRLPMLDQLIGRRVNRHSSERSRIVSSLVSRS